MNSQKSSFCNATFFRARSHKRRPFFLRIRPASRWYQAWLLTALITSLSLSSVQAETTPQIIIKGAPDALRDNIKQYMTIASESCSAPLWRLQSLLDEVQQDAENAAQALGYYQTTFTTEFTQRDNCWQLHLDVTPGEEVRIGEVNIVINGDGANDKSFKKLLNNPPIKVGDKLNHGTYESLKNRITNLASSHGYFDGRFEVSSIRVNVIDNTAAVELIYASGTRYKIGEIRVTHDILSEAFLRRYLVVDTGDYYDTDKLLEIKNLYNKSNYFTVSTATPDLQNLENYEVPIDIILEQRKRHAYSIGLGAATDTGPRVLLGYEDRYVNDSGHSITADANASTTNKNLEFAYTIPMSKPADQFLNLLAGYENKLTDSAYSIKKTVGVSYSDFQSNKWLYTYALNYEHEFSRADKEKTTNLVLPSLTVFRTRTDGNPYPLHGWTFTARISGAPETLGSDVSFLQFYTRAKFIQALPVGRLLLRGEFGTTQVDDINDLPVTKRFYAGGDTSVRGYNYESLGPSVIDEGVEKVIGGKNLLVGSIEYDYLIRDKWAVATFYDIGNAAQDFAPVFKSSAGVGVRWISPVGPVRLDFAQALDDEKGWKIVFTMGPDL